MGPDYVFYYHRDGRPILERMANGDDTTEVRQLWRDMEDPFSEDARFVASTTLRGVRVSTVFLGLNHQHGLDEGLPPLIFETMIFGGRHDQTTIRYSTEERARGGHEAVVSVIRWWPFRRHLTKVIDDYWG